VGRLAARRGLEIAPRAEAPEPGGEAGREPLDGGVVLAHRLVVAAALDRDPVLGSLALATVDPRGQPTTGITRTRTRQREFSPEGSAADVKKLVEAWDPDRYLNIWVCTLAAGMLRYSQFPGGPKETDGVVVHHRAFGTIGTAQAPFDKGRSLTGGIAMYLNLLHIWGDTDDCTDGDFVADTPPQKGPNFGSPTFPTRSCPEAPHGDMFMNFMDYVDDDAMYMFTKGQVLRMREALQGPRRKLRVS
jgi:hypothetical protein